MNKKVLHVLSVSFSIKYFIGNQFIYFKTKGVEFHVACSYSDELMKLSEEYGFTAFPIPIKRAIDPLEDIKSIYKLTQYIKKEKFDIVITHSPKGGMIGSVASFFAGTQKRVYFRHGLVFETLKGTKQRLLILVEKLNGTLSHAVVNVSLSIQRKSEKLRLNKSFKNIVLGKGTCNGVDIHRFQYREGFKDKDVKVVGFVGRISKDKGIVQLIEAWKILKQSNANIKLLLVGPIDDRDPIENSLLEYINNEISIDFFGEVSDVKHYYNMMDIFVLPSFREGFPTVTLEASASRLPVITSRATGCIDSIIDNTTGIFTEITGIKIAEAIQRYLDNPQELLSHGLNGEKFIRDNFAEEIVYLQVEKHVLSSNYPLFKNPRIV